MYDSAMIMKDDLDRIKRESIILTQDDKRGLWAQDHEARQRLAKLSQDRRSQLQAFDKIRKPLQPLVSSVVGIETVWSRAQAMLDEEEDDVKAMNRATLFMRTMQIRDRQLQENSILETEFVQNQRRLDSILELERLKELQLQNERRYLRKQALLANRAAVVEQIAEKDIQKQKEKQLLELEKQ